MWWGEGEGEMNWKSRVTCVKEMASGKLVWGERKHMALESNKLRFQSQLFNYSSETWMC